MPAFFSQGCPTCGRTLNVRSADANRRVVCKHCQGAFVAQKPKQGVKAQDDWRTAMVQRADELLAIVALRAKLVATS